MTRFHLRGAPHALLLLALAACGGSNTTTEVEDPVPTSLELSTSDVQLDYLGQTQRVSATVLDQSGGTIAGAVTWSSQDESVAEVTAAGVIRAVSNGSTTVEATAGSLTESVSVTVEQVASVVQAQSGDDQSGLAGTPLADPVVAVVRDQGGAPVEGVGVTFVPGVNSGSVDPTSGTSGADGTVATTWTLDAKFGPQTVVASIDADDFEFNAFGGSDTPTPDLRIPDGVELPRSDPTSLESFTVEATVLNQGDGDATAFRVQLLVGGSEVASADVPALAAGTDVEVAFPPVGPLSPGASAIEVVVDPDDDILELDETNNVVDRDVTVKLQEVVTPGTPVGSLDGDPGDELLFFVDVGGSPTNVTVSLSGGSGDVDLWIERGERPRNRIDYDDCVSDGPTMGETCQLPESSGPLHIIVFAPENVGGPSGFTNSTLAVSLGDPVETFDLQIQIVDGGTPAQEQAFLDAAAIWNDIIIGDIPDYDLGGATISADTCIDGQPQLTGVIDDVIIYAAIVSIDGQGGTLGQAGPCFLRNGSSLPFVGLMELDAADLDQLENNGGLESVILHEMGHVLGIGSLWELRDLLQAASTTGSGSSCTVSNPDADTHFTGPKAIAAFDAAGGAGYPDSKVPVANGELGAGCGSADGHWRESVMDSELMTPFTDGAANPLSAITVQSLADLGYFVDETQADPYVLPATPPLVAAPATGASPGSNLIDLGDDIYRGPVWVAQPGGGFVRIRR